MIKEIWCTSLNFELKQFHPEDIQKMQNLLRVQQSVWSRNCSTALNWEQHSYLNKSCNFPQQIAGGKKPVTHLEDGCAPFHNIPRNLSDLGCPTTTMANQSLIQHHAMLTGSPRLWGGSGAAAKADVFIARESGSWWAAPVKAKRAGQARPKRDQTGDPAAAAAGSLAAGMAGLGQQWREQLVSWVWR